MYYFKVGELMVALPSCSQILEEALLKSSVTFPRIAGVPLLDTLSDCKVDDFLHGALDFWELFLSEIKGSLLVRELGYDCSYEQIVDKVIFQVEMV